MATEIQPSNFWNKGEMDARYIRKDVDNTANMVIPNGADMILTSPNGTEFAIKVENTGQIIPTENV